jgi:hypothetical protein
MGAKAIIEVRAFLRERIIGLNARARRLSRIDYDSVGIRPQDLPFVPSPDHFKAATSAWHRSIRKSPDACEQCSVSGRTRHRSGF